MDLTTGNSEEKEGRAKKMMLWFGMASMLMMFAGLTSAYIVSKNRPDWLTDFEIPTPFYWSTLIIFLSSLSMILASRAISRGSRQKGTYFLWLTLLLGITFVYLQFQGFGDFVSRGLFFTGSESNVTTSFVYVLVVAHLAHLLGGILVLLVLIYNHFKQRYVPGQVLGLELGATYWHFVDGVWIFLIFFLYFFR